MGSREEACLECRKKCLLIHRKKDSISNITSFFKVMIGNKFLDILLLPPKFARKVLALVDVKTHIEDLSGRQWEITISNVNGSLAFHRGWHAFALDHHLDNGDFVVFHYVVGSHFIAQVYDRTGCEKPAYSENSQPKKITKRKRSPISNDHVLRTIDKHSINEQVSSMSDEIIQSRSNATDVEIPMVVANTSNYENCNAKLKSVSKVDYVEEQYYMINRDLGYKQGEYRSSIFDLSNFEMQNHADRRNNTVSVDVKSSILADKLPVLKTEKVVADGDTVAEEVGGEVVGEYVSNFEITEKNKDPNVMGKIKIRDRKDSYDNRASERPLTKSAEELREKRKDSADLGNEGIKDCQSSAIRSKTHSIDMKNLKKECVEIISEVHHPDEMIGERALKLLKELHHQSFNPTGNDKDKIFKKVKTKAVDFDGPTPPIAANLSCFAGKDDQSFLELPTGLSLASYIGRTRMERQVVFLQDPEMRLWPVLYHERHDFQVLTSGWEDFRRANGIRPGDECVLVVENEFEGIYAVRIVHKQG